MTVDEITALDPILRDGGIGPLAETMINKRQHAAELRAWSARVNGLTPELTQAQADRLDADADVLSDISAHRPTPMVVGTGGEVLPDALKPRSFVDTMRDRPDAVAVDASRHRLSLAKMAGVAAMALDAAETAQAENSLEKMLAHQCAAAHAIAMQLQAEALSLLADFQKTGRRLAILTTEAARLVNVSGRMMETSQRAMMTLHRLRNSGRQTVVVQHVHVSDGGQAVVAGQMRGRGRSKRTA
jgi:hypothetical protein